MTLYCFAPKLADPPTAIGRALSRQAYPLDCRVPKPLAELLKRLERR